MIETAQKSFTSNQTECNTVSDLLAILDQQDLVGVLQKL